MRHKYLDLVFEYIFIKDKSDRIGLVKPKL